MVYHILYKAYRKNTHPAAITNASILPVKTGQQNRQGALSPRVINTLKSSRNLRPLP
jgi:hypothetical protein